MDELWAREILPPASRSGLDISNLRNSVKWNCRKPRTPHWPGEGFNVWGQADLPSEESPSFVRAQTAFLRRHKMSCRDPNPVTQPKADAAIVRIKNPHVMDPRRMCD